MGQVNEHGSSHAHDAGAPHAKVLRGRVQDFRRLRLLHRAFVAL